MFNNMFFLCVCSFYTIKSNKKEKGISNMGRKRSNIAIEVEKQEQYERGQRIKYIREKELHLSKTDLAVKIGTSSQFLGLVEEGKGNLVYYSLRKLREVSGHSADYILFGVDDNSINKTKKLLKDYSEEEIASALEVIEKLSLFIKNK